MPDCPYPVDPFNRDDGKPLFPLDPGAMAPHDKTHRLGQSGDRARNLGREAENYARSVAGANFSRAVPPVSQVPAPAVNADPVLAGYAAALAHDDTRLLFTNPHYPQLELRCMLKTTRFNF
jgi:hypothetical protein